MYVVCVVVVVVVPLFVLVEGELFVRLALPDTPMPFVPIWPPPDTEVEVLPELRVEPLVVDWVVVTVELEGNCVPWRPSGVVQGPLAPRRVFEILRALLWTCAIAEVVPAAKKAQSARPMHVFFIMCWVDGTKCFHAKVMTVLQCSQCTVYQQFYGTVKKFYDSRSRDRYAKKSMHRASDMRFGSSVLIEGWE